MVAGTLTERVTKLEETVSEILARLDVQAGSSSTGGGAVRTEDFEELKASVRNLGAMVDEVTTQLSSLAGTSSSGEVAAKVKEVVEDVALLKRAVAADGGGRAADGPFRSDFKVPEPKGFNGTRSSKDLENFLWDIEQYFQTAKVSMNQQVNFASMYLIGDAKLRLAVGRKSQVLRVVAPSHHRHSDPSQLVSIKLTRLPSVPHLANLVTPSPTVSCFLGLS